MDFLCGNQFATRDVPLTERDLHDVEFRGNQTRIPC